MTPVGTVSGSTVSFDDGTLRDQPGFQITPKRDRQFTRQGDDHDAPDAPLLALSAGMEPPAQGAIRLMAEPKPCGFDHANVAKVATIIGAVVVVLGLVGLFSNL